MFDLLELAENKAFAALSNEERQFVLAFMSESAYQNLYETAARLRHADAAPAPPPALREAILRHLPAPQPWYRRSVSIATLILACLCSTLTTYLLKPGQAPPPGNDARTGENNRSKNGYHLPGKNKIQNPNH